MENIFKEFGLGPKTIDCGNGNKNMKFRSIDSEGNMCNNAVNRHKKKKSNE
ncbi:MAG: hypothetical protein K5986_03020 [Clostridium sp.]|uniref:hypothetical protein n=1 Tax=Clostridium sp. DSM 8431 TaxID=1761781 RepID=UPI0008EAD98A|nr:hypothetical protein [Clostridium sp. DSM 8431]MCR4943426.1 hypothetical protein [Clostridium sp.]SFU44927.1 hypothetical protein SAMN04487886_103015 [Clostridium sp. DSM 8431]